MTSPHTTTPPRLRTLDEQLRKLSVSVAAAAVAGPPGDGEAAGLSCAERIRRVLDPDSAWIEIGQLRGYDRHDGAAPGAGVVTGVGVAMGKPVVIVASNPVVAGGAWWPETVDKVLRAQDIAMRQALPIAYLLEGGRVQCVGPDGIVPGSYGPGRVLALAATMRRMGRAVQLAVRFGSLQSPGAVLAELCDCTYSAAEAGLERARARVGAMGAVRRLSTRAAARPPAEPAARLFDILPRDHRRSYDMGAVLACLLDGGELDEFQSGHAAELVCGHGWIEGHAVAVIANRRGVIPAPKGPPRLGGIIYRESASKVAYFIEAASRERIPLVFIQDVSGFMLGVDAEHAGIIRAGAELVEAMATARSARLTLTINHASGAGYYAMAGQGFDPDFTLAWPTGRIGAMEAESAIMAAYGTAIARSGGSEAGTSPAVQASIAAMRASFECELGALHAAARGHVDAVISPERTRSILGFLLAVTARPAVLDGWARPAAPGAPLHQGA